MPRNKQQIEDDGILEIVNKKRWCDFCTRYSMRHKNCDYLGIIKTPKVKPCSWFNRKNLSKLRKLLIIGKLLKGKK